MPDRFEIAIWGDDELRLCAGQACHKATAVEGVLAWQELSTRTDPQRYGLTRRRRGTWNFWN